MMKKNYKILISCLSLILSINLMASPYIDCDASIKLNNHRWGIWRFVDVPTQNLDDMFNYSELKTYWVFGLGPYFKVHITQGTLILFVLLLLTAITIAVYFKKKSKNEPHEKEIIS